jgi:hypothetical protein
VAFGDAYLTRPLTEADLPAETWGSESMALDLAGGSYLFSGLSSAQVEWTRDRFEALCEPAPPAFSDCSTSVYRVPVGTFRELDTRGWEYTFDRDYQPGRLRLAGRDFVAEICFEPGPRARLWTSQADPERFGNVFENLVRILVAYQVAHSGGVLLHSGSFARHDVALVVFGRSGAGKSTSSRVALEAGWEVLSDDMNALLPAQERWHVRKLPFAGDLGQTPTSGRAYAVAGLLWLEQATSHALHPMSESVALARLLSCSPIVNEDPYRVEGLLHNLTNLLAKTGVATLHFAPDAGFLSLLDPGSGVCRG